MVRRVNDVGGEREESQWEHEDEARNVTSGAHSMADDVLVVGILVTVSLSIKLRTIVHSTMILLVG